MDDFPEELLFHILSYLPLEHISVGTLPMCQIIIYFFFFGNINDHPLIYQAAAVSIKWRDAVLSDHFYELMYRKRYPSDNSMGSYLVILNVVLICF